MKNKLLELLTERGEICITNLKNFMPEIKGNYDIYMPVNQGINPNILWLSGVTQEFIKVFNVLLVEEKSIIWEPRSVMVFMIDNAPIYKMDIFNPKKPKSKKTCWLPICIMLNK